MAPETVEKRDREREREKERERESNNVNPAGLDMKDPVSWLDPSHPTSLAFKFTACAKGPFPCGRFCAPKQAPKIQWLPLNCSCQSPLQVTLKTRALIETVENQASGNSGEWGRRMTIGTPNLLLHIPQSSTSPLTPPPPTRPAHEWQVAAGASARLCKDQRPRSVENELDFFSFGARHPESARGVRGHCTPGPGITAAPFSLQPYVKMAKQTDPCKPPVGFRPINHAYLPSDTDLNRREQWPLPPRACDDEAIS